MIARVVKALTVLGPPRGECRNGVLYFGELGKGSIKLFIEAQDGKGIRLHTEAVPEEHPSFNKLKRTIAALRQHSQLDVRITPSEAQRTEWREFQGKLAEYTRNTRSKTRGREHAVMDVIMKLEQQLGLKTEETAENREGALRELAEEQIKEMQKPLKLITVEAFIPIDKATAGGVQLAEKRTITQAQIDELMTAAAKQVLIDEVRRVLSRRKETRAAR